MNEGPPPGPGHLHQIVDLARRDTTNPRLLDHRDKGLLRRLHYHWCEAAQVAFTRSRPYRKNDQAHVEQKNGAVVRRMVGYHRYAGIAAATELSRLYRDMRLYVNFFQPSFELMEKTRDWARVAKRYHAPLTPFQHVQAHPAVAQAAKDALATQLKQLDPVV